MAQEGGGDDEFPALQAEIDDFLKDLQTSEASVPKLANFKREYEIIYERLQKSHDSGSTLNKRLAGLRLEIRERQEKTLQAEKDAEDSQSMKQRLQSDITSAWAQVAESHKREAKAQEKSNEIKAKIQSLQEQLTSGSGWSEEQQSQMKALQKTKNELTRDVETKTSTLSSARTEADHLFTMMQDEEQEKLELDEEIAKLKGEVAEKRAQAERELRRKDRLDKELKELKVEVECAQADLEKKNVYIKEGEGEIAKMEGQLREAKLQMEKYLREYDSLFRKTHKLTEELEEQMHNNQMVQSENQQREHEVSEKVMESDKVELDVARVQKQKTKTEEMIVKLDEEREEVERKKEELKAEVNQLQTIEIVTQRKEGELHRKQIDDLLREREILNKKLVKADEKTRRTQDLVKIHENTKKNLENEINGYRAHVKRQRDMIQQLVQDRERYEGEAESANQKYYNAQEEVKLQELQISALQKKIVEGETRLKQQQNLYEQVRSDRNLYSKQLIESQDEIAEMKRKFKIMNHQIEQLKEEITAKDHALVKEHFDHHKVDKEKEGLKNELTRIRKQIQSSEQIIANQETEVLKLSAIIGEADAERTRQTKEYDAVVNERDILGGQLIRRTEELATLYEKIKIQKSTLTKGEVCYEERMAEIQLLMERLGEMNAERHVSQAQVANMEDLRNEVYQLQRELLQERTKIKALSEELERPLNVHRWRKLEGSDPQRFDQIRKIQSLQKRLISKTEEVVERDLLIQEKEKLYVELKNILARQPGPEVAEQLSVYQQNLKEKAKQMKAMNSELEMYKSQLGEYKYELEQLGGEMEEVKQQWFSSMREQAAAQAHSAKQQQFDEMEGGVNVPV